MCVLLRHISYLVQTAQCFRTPVLYNTKVLATMHTSCPGPLLGEENHFICYICIDEMPCITLVPSSTCRSDRDCD